MSTEEAILRQRFAGVLDRIDGHGDNAVCVRVGRQGSVASEVEPPSEQSAHAVDARAVRLRSQLKRAGRVVPAAVNLRAKCRERCRDVFKPDRPKEESPKWRSGDRLQGVRERRAARQSGTAFKKSSTKPTAMFRSDIVHCDVPDMNEILEDAYELVEHDVAKLLAG